MHEIQVAELDHVTGGGKASTILKGAEKAYEVAKPWIKKGYNALEKATVVGAAIDLGHKAWNWATGKKE